MPVIAIGGVTPARAAELFAVGAHAVAVVGAMSAAADPAATAARFAAVLAAAPAGAVHGVARRVGPLAHDVPVRPPRPLPRYIRNVG